MKRIAILGSTGNIGRQTLEVIKANPDKLRIVGLACYKDSDLFKAQVKEFKPKITAVTEKEGEGKLISVATQKDADIVVVAVVGLAGLAPTLAAIKSGKTIALATKEVLVIAGELVIREARKHGVKILPIDSEHSAIFQCLLGGKAKEINKIFLTMGKGPIAKIPRKQLDKVTLKDIFNRPAWSMGTKIAVDSATGINKAFEVVEAHWLFGLPQDMIKILVHPQYLCHSLAEFIDGSIFGEFGVPDMKRYIQYSLTYPDRIPAAKNLFGDLLGKTITFEAPPYSAFPCLTLGFSALKAGGTMPAVLHGADTAAVNAFIKGKIRFTQIYPLINKVMKQHKVIMNPTLSQLIEAEKWGEEKANE